MQTVQKRKKLKRILQTEIIDESSRIFQINLNAATTGRNPDVAAQKASVVLVLDASDSLGSKGLTAVKDSAKSFISTLKESSPESEVSIVWFNGNEGSSGTTTVRDYCTLTDAGVNTLNAFINSKTKVDGGTPMGDALSQAYTKIKDAHNSNKYVLLFTDGMPGHLATNSSSDSNSMFNCMVANSAVNYANDIKAKATIYTVGYKLSGTLYWHKGDSATSSADTEHGYYSGWGWGQKYDSNHDLSTSASDFLKNYIATTAPTGSNKKYAYTVNNTEDLGKEFKKLAAQIGAYYSINAEKIVDVIDARFELTEAGRKALVGDAKAITNEDGSKTYVKETRKDGAVVGTVRITENTDGTTTIEWTGTEAHR